MFDYYFIKKNGKLRVEYVAKARGHKDIEQLDGFVSWIDPKHPTEVSSECNAEENIRLIQEFWASKG